MNDSNKVINYIKQKELQVGDEINLSELTKEFSDFIKKNNITLNTETAKSDIAHTVRGALETLKNNNYIEKVNPKNDGLHKVIVASNMW